MAKQVVNLSELTIEVLRQSGECIGFRVKLHSLDGNLIYAFESPLMVHTDTLHIYFKGPDNDGDYIGY